MCVFIHLHSWLIRVHDMTHSTTWHYHSHVWHATLICFAPVIYMCDLSFFIMTHSHVRYGFFTYATWTMTRSNVQCGSFICAKLLIHMCDMTHPYVRHDSFVCATWLIHMHNMTHDHFICAKWLIHTWQYSHMNASYCTYKLCAWPARVTRLTHMSDRLIHSCDMTHSFMWWSLSVTWLTHKCDMNRSSAWHRPLVSAITHLHAWHEPFRRVTWLTRACEKRCAGSCHAKAMHFQRSPFSSELYTFIYVYIYTYIHI